MVASMSHTERQSQPVTRNAPCPCGSGRKYKRCCLKASAREQEPVDRSGETAVQAVPETVGERRARASAERRARTDGERQALAAAGLRAAATMELDGRSSFAEVLRGAFGFAAHVRHVSVLPDHEGDDPAEPGQYAYLDRFVALLGSARTALADSDDHTFLKMLGFIPATPRHALSLSLDEPVLIYPSVWTSTGSVTGVPQTLAGALVHRYAPGGVEVFPITEMMRSPILSPPVAFTDIHTDALAGALRWRVGRAEPNYVRQGALERAFEREQAELAVLMVGCAGTSLTPQRVLSAEEMAFHVATYEALPSRYTEDAGALHAMLRMLYPPMRLPDRAIDEITEYLRPEGLA